MLSLVVCEQALGDYRSVLYCQPAHGTNLAIATRYQFITGKAWMPLGHAIEILDRGPNFFRGRLDLHRLRDVKSLRGSRHRSDRGKCGGETKSNEWCFHPTLSRE